MTETYRLYGAPPSYYTGKARSYLRFKRIAFEEIISSNEVFKTVIEPRTGVRFIPVLISPDDVAVQDTTDIIDFLEARVPEPSVYPSTPRQRLASLLFELYGDEWLVIPAMHYRWSFPTENRDFILREFGASAAPDAPPEAQRVAGEKVASVFGGFLPILGVNAATIPAIEASYLALLADLDRHFATYPFLFGDRPSIGDFGLMGPLYAHLGRDPYPLRLMQAQAPNLLAWVDRMNQGEGHDGAFLADDRVPATLEPVLARMFAEQWPVLADTAKQLEAWAAANPGAELPRAIGMHAFRIGEATGTRGVFTYPLWMAQRPLDYRASLDADTRAALDAWLAPLGGDALTLTPAVRLARRENKVVIA